MLAAVAYFAAPSGVDEPTTADRGSKLVKVAAQNAAFGEATTATPSPEPSPVAVRTTVPLVKRLYAQQKMPVGHRHLLR